MERGSFQGIAAGLERIVEANRFDLREVMEQFQELCLTITSERDVPAEIIINIRQTYKKIQDQLTKISATTQLLEGKYRQYYHRDFQREREIMEFSFLAKSLYSKFEYTLQEAEAKRKLTDKKEQLGPYRQRIPFQWFQSKENQIMLLKNLRDLSGLDYKTCSDLEHQQKREVVRNGMRSISLFVLSGEAALINHLASLMRLREYDIKERSSWDECRGALTHLKEVFPLDVEMVIRRLSGGCGLLKAKCLLLLGIQSQKDLEKEIIGSTKNILRVMEVGEVRTLSI
ncbi:MAG TPA: hypothetical protein VEK32_13470 [Thermodesulfobacteriota bacterium]|nr:hypothetical protein [Thermodesulfobacteriota bacterium]